MKKIMTAALLSLSIANVSCEETKQEDTPWYISHKKFFLASCAKSLIFLGESATICASKGAMKYSTHSFSKEFMQRFPNYFKQNINAESIGRTLFSNMIVTVFFVSIFKNIHNRNKKKQKKAEEVF